MISAIVMASGFGRRMTKEKLILPVQNIPMVERVVKEVENSKVDEIILVYRSKDVNSIVTKYNIKTIYNDKANLGQSESIKLGVKSSSDNTEGYMFCVGDQPYLNRETIHILIDEFNENKEFIIVPVYGQNRGNPVIFPAKYKKELLMLQGDIGGRNIIKNNIKNVKFIQIEDVKQGTDIDDLHSYYKLMKNNEEQ